jgi:hypothetical protein
MKYVWLTNMLRQNTGGGMLPDTSTQDEFIEDASIWEQWLADKAIGEPKPADGASVDQLKAEGYVGVYKYVWA